MTQAGRPATITPRIRELLTQHDSGLTAGAIARALDLSLKQTLAALNRLRKQGNALSWVQRETNATLWGPTGSTGTTSQSEDVVSGEAVLTFSDEQLVDELDEVIDALGQVEDMAAILRQLRERLPQLLRSASLGDLVMGAVAQHE